MKVVWIDGAGKQHVIPESVLGQDCVEVEPCECGCKLVAGNGKRIASDDRHYEADAYCCGCKARRGTLQAWPETLFGLHEDEAVFASGCVIY